MTDLEKLADDWRYAKAQEETARKERVAIEERIVALTGCKEEGSQTHEAGEYKVTVTGKLNRKLNPEKWQEIERTIASDMRPVTYVPKLETKGLRYLENNEPEIYARVVEAIETKPAKPAVEVK